MTTSLRILSWADFDATMASKCPHASRSVFASSVIGTAHFASATSSPRIPVSRQSDSSAAFPRQCVRVHRLDIRRLVGRQHGTPIVTPSSAMRSLRPATRSLVSMEEQERWNVTRSVGDVEAAFRAIPGDEGDGCVVRFDGGLSISPESW